MKHISILLTFFLFSTSVFHIHSTPNSLIMVTEIWAPYRMDDSNTKSGFTGIDIDICIELEKRLGIPILIYRRPWARALSMMMYGQADIITGVAYTDERAEYLLYAPTSYSSVRPVFYTTKGNADFIQVYDDLYGKSIGYSLNSAYFEPFNSDTGLNKVGLSTEVQILQVLANNRLDLAIGTDPNMSWDIAVLGLKDILEKTTYQPPVETKLYFAVSKKSHAVGIIDKIDSILKEMLNDGTIENIKDQYR